MFLFNFWSMDGDACGFETRLIEAVPKLKPTWFFNSVTKASQFHGFPKVQAVCTKDFIGLKCSNNLVSDIYLFLMVLQNPWDNRWPKNHKQSTAPKACKSSSVLGPGGVLARRRCEPHRLDPLAGGQHFLMYGGEFLDQFDGWNSHGFIDVL